MPAHYRTKSRTFPKTYIPSREARIADADTGAYCHLAFSTPRAEDRAFNEALVSITRFSYFTTAPLDWRLSLLQNFKPHSEIPSAIFTNNDPAFSRRTAGVRRKS